jgi:arylsulfatase A-like enzyme
MTTLRHLRRYALLVATLLLVTVAGPGLLGSPTGHAQVAVRPNIILITTDDMAETDLRWMPKTNTMLRDMGVRVGDFISNHPLCCPARAQIFTGQYAHNNGVRTNGGDYGGYPNLIDKGNHVGAWLTAAGYKTAFVGKHLNGWNDSAHHQPGWTIFNPYLKGIYNPFEITTFNNGRPKHYSGIHTSDLISRLTVDYIKRFSASGAPFFIWASQVSPHIMLVRGRWVDPVPAARHRYLYPTAVPPSLSRPSFNEADVRDKPVYVRERALYSRTRAIAAHRARIRTLRSVDDQVAATLQALRATGELANTYLFFTSDNGFLLGEHRWAGKNVPYEEALQVPLLVRGPDLPGGVIRNATYAVIDLAPTFVDLAGATAQRTMDGRSMMATLRAAAPGYSRLLIQAARGEHEPWWWRGVRTAGYTYVTYSDGFEELYDRNIDPYQVNNAAGDPSQAQVLAAHRADLDALRDCSGDSCRVDAQAPHE